VPHSFAFISFLGVGTSLFLFEDARGIVDFLLKAFLQALSFEAEMLC
jgi:hypothetical protein